MYISRILLRNFRNFAHLDTKLSPGVTCVLGENNTGKTNLLYAIRLAIDANLSSRHRVLADHDFRAGVNYRDPSQIIVAVEFADFENSTNQKAVLSGCEFATGKARISYRFRPRTSIREEINNGTKKPGELTIEDYHFEITGGGPNDPSKVKWDESLGASIRFQDLQALKVECLAALRDVEGGLGHSGNSPIARLLDCLKIPDADRLTLVSMLKEANVKIADHRAIKDVGTAAKDAFKKTAGEAFHMDLRIGLVEPSFGSITRALNVLLSDGTLADFDSSRNGLGLNNILYISLLLEYFEKRQKTKESAGELILIEEPEAHLHPTLQRVLYKTLAQKPVQTIVTTHSTHISSAAPLKSFVVLSNDRVGGTSAMTLWESADLSAGDIADLERFLDATRSTLLYARKVVLVEGPAELFLLGPLLKKVLDFDLDRHGIAVVPIHGTHFRVYAQLFRTGILKKRCAIIADCDDSSGELAQDDVHIIRKLTTHENTFLRTFGCATTFEHALTIPGLLGPLIETAKELGEAKLQKALEKAAKRTFEANDKLPTDLLPLREDVLSAAKAAGKARFAQVMSKHLENATAVPKYISAAVDWLNAP